MRSFRQRQALAAAISTLASIPTVWAGLAGAVTIAFDYSLDTNKFFLNNATARETLERAGAFYSNVLTDTLDPITPSGGNSWDQRFTHPTTGQQPFHPVFNPPGFRLFDRDVPADTLVVYVGARDLGVGVLASATFGTSGATGDPAWLDTVARRSQPGTASGPAANEVATWGGSMTFDLDTNWNDDWRRFPLAGENDLYSVALHELAHVLGLGTADAWYAAINGGVFTGPASAAANGGAEPGVTPGGGHWLDGTTSRIYLTPSAQETALDPDILLGARKLPTDLDLAGLDDIGWDLAPPVAGDYDYDGTLDGDDLDELFANLGGAGAYNRARFNLVDDAVIDQQDADAWLADLAGTVRGDTDLDGDTDLLDAIRLILAYTGVNGAADRPRWADGNTDGDFDIDLTDAAALRRAFSGPTPPPAVPEPTAIGLLVPVMAAWRARPIRTGSQSRDEKQA